MRGTGSRWNRAAVCGAAALLCGWAHAHEVHLGCILSGLQATPANTSSGIGCGVFTVDTAAKTVSYRIVVAGLSGAETTATIRGFVGVGSTGSVQVTLPAGDLKTGVWNYNPADEPAILSGQAYVLVQSSAFPNGEVRGQISNLSAVLDSAQQVPTNTSVAVGFGVFDLDPVAHQLSYTVAFFGIGSEAGAHIHGPALYGSSGPIVHTLPTGPIKTGVWNYPVNVEAALWDGLYYVDVHSTSKPGGEIRGQIVSSVNPMDRLQEVPTTASASMGRVLCALDRANNKLGYDMRLRLSGSTESATHLHGYAVAGVNAPIKTTLTNGTRKIGVWTFPSLEGGSVADGLVYADVHTTANPNGEIRGQLVVWPAPCPPDFNGDGFLDIYDFTTFVACFEGSACPPGETADFNNDGFVDIYDFGSFVEAFEAGCS